MGKSQMVRELEHYLLNALRTTLESSLGGRCSKDSTGHHVRYTLTVPLHLEEDLDTELGIGLYWEETLGTGRYYLFDHWGSTSEDNLLARVRYMAKALDCKWIS